MSIQRKIIKTDFPKSEPGFLGAGHMARPLISGSFCESDPFILLMDDVLDKKDTTPVGGPHPHAGFETVSFLLEGEIGDDAHKMKGGDFQMMTAGSGIVHTETIDKKARMRLLQLWLNLPKKNRWAIPRVQDLPLEHVPALSAKGVSIRLYSGTLADLTSPVQNYTPLIVADITLDARTTTVQQIPSDYNAFLYIIDGHVLVGDDEQPLEKEQVGWLDLFDQAATSDLKLTTAESGARLILYAGKPTGESIVSHGPFIGDTSEDIQRLFSDYRRGKMQHISSVSAGRKILW